MRISVRRPSPALVISCVALTVALGGTSYATVLQVPKNSVGTPQLKNSAVTTAKVKNRSLLRADFAAGSARCRPCGTCRAGRPSGTSRAVRGKRRRAHRDDVAERVDDNAIRLPRVSDRKAV